MFIIYGKRQVKTKSYTHHEYPCKNCNDFDLKIDVYREYFHVFFLPLFPIGKEIKIRCNNCGEPKWINSIQQQYEKSGSPPFYLYTGIILAVGLVLLVIVVNLNTQMQKAKFVANPLVGDIYTIRSDEKGTASYYFLKVSKVNGDTVHAYHNNLVYHSYVSTLNSGDFFVEGEELIFTKKDLKAMLDKKEINSVDRD